MQKYKILIPNLSMGQCLFFFANCLNCIDRNFNKIKNVICLLTKTHFLEVQMKKLYSLTLLVLAITFITDFSSPVFAQKDKVRKSLKANVTQRIGVDTDITIDFSRPGVKGRKIWGELVPYGMNPGNKYSNDKPYPWRAGANENTTIEFNHDLMIEGNKVPAGNYGIHMLPSEDEWTIMFSKTNDAWGSYSYDEKNDILRIKVKPVEAPHQEWLTFGFDNLTGNSTVAFLHWEKLKVPFKIELPE